MKTIKCDICGQEIVSSGPVKQASGTHIRKSLIGEIYRDGHVDICNACWRKIKEERRKEMHENN